MRIVYRMRGLLGDATEDMVNSLDSGRGSSPIIKQNLSVQIPFPFYYSLTVSHLQFLYIFTARCTLVQSAVLLSYVVRLSVTFRYRDHIGWNSSKIISRPNSLGPM